MPIYEYQCPACDFVFEKFVSMSDPNKPTCPKCEGRTKKIVSRSSFHLKGGGWAKDGYCPTSGGKKGGG